MGLKDTKTKKSLKREAIEWGVFLSIILFLYATGLHTQVAGTLQGLILKTGVMTPKALPAEQQLEADLNFQLRDMEGNPLSLSEHEGKVIFINFWATWCPPCIAEMPDINDLYVQLEQEPWAKGNVAFAMISVDKDAAKLDKFVAKKDYQFPIYKPTGYIPEVFKTTSIPTTFVVSPEGKIIMRKEGMASYDNEGFINFLKENLPKNKEITLN